ncbi:helix-turn-helix domain-containing protein [Spirosoma sp. HMF3257]|uniref:Helix-turn-helix domain-containing protein n=1 Tax=Spirosoma telluris TaxID=2183553 RepID=A0A327NL22_9BACT|nr:helix-turn-helix domain-containing protein [Spirosoma telluris]MVM36670.1 helix-turn-helix domain-containing protein [Spirosoma telluris]MVM36942.1 helix-turn-helix domain-containing protein [Spirosoma telluris]MVM37088.1 helix-turn-helix domain-containing protein [Spirosoma telluris]MVM38121.1 helix-turn-helix domain-containing protein [Spirosoma telluris]
MGRVNTPILSEEQRIALEYELKTNDNHSFRARCQAILLKAAGRSSTDVGQIVGMCHVSINSWLKRFKTSGLDGLKTKPGRGRKPILTKQTDTDAVLAAVKANRQRIQLAKADWETSRSAGSQPVSESTFRTFLKSLMADTNAFVDE